ncbi:MAG: hypothetical protein K6E83_12990 [Clostridium sp.]|nr:hypothetical protein [Clostridium sp.]
MNNRSNLANALMWGGGGLMYLAADHFLDVGVFKVLAYLFILLGVMYLIRYLKGRF